jgi:hypothetical protein
VGKLPIKSSLIIRISNAIDGIKDYAAFGEQFVKLVRVEYPDIRAAAM